MAFVRAEAPDGSRFTIDEGALKSLGSKLLKGEDALDQSGRPLPAESAKSATKTKEA